MSSSPYINEFLLQGRFGIERETLRVDRYGRLAQTPHPFSDDALSRDFCENQLEIITPVCSSISEAMDSLRALSYRASAFLRDNGESLWLYSNPPRFDSENEIPVAAFSGDQSNKRNYRENLERRYGKRLMLFSGIHFNFSLSEQYLQSLHADTGDCRDYEQFRTDLYFRLFKQLCRYSWLPMLLTAASPVYDSSLDGETVPGSVTETLLSPYSSMRNSGRGYWNQFVPQLDYSGLRPFIDSIDSYIKKGALFSASELYLPIRLKPRGQNSLKGLLSGISHLELRMFDLNPLEPLGISETDLRFAHALMLYLLTLDDFELTPELQKESIQNHQRAALYDLEGVTVGGEDIITAAVRVLSEMRSYFADFPEILRIIAYEREKLTGKRLCQKIAERFGSNYTSLLCAGDI